MQHPAVARNGPARAPTRAEGVLAYALLPHILGLQNVYLTPYT